MLLRSDGANTTRDATQGVEPAQRPYVSLGFVVIPAYRPNPVPRTSYFELALS